MAEIASFELATHLKMVICPLTQMVFSDPICTPELVVFEREAYGLFKSGKNSEEMIRNSQSHSIIPSILPNTESPPPDIKTSILVKSLVATFLESHPKYTSQVFSMKAYLQALKTDFVELIKADPKGAIVMIDDRGSYRLLDSIYDFRNFEIETLMETKTPGHRSLHKMIIGCGDRYQLIHLIDNLAYGRFDNDSILKPTNKLHIFVQDFLDEVLFRFNQSPDFANPPELEIFDRNHEWIPDPEFSKAYPDYKIVSLFEFTMRYLTFRHPLIKKILFESPTLSKKLIDDPPHRAKDVFYRCGFRYPHNYTLTILKHSYGRRIENILRNINFKGNEAGIIDTIFRNNCMDRETKSMIIRRLYDEDKDED